MFQQTKYLNIVELVKQLQLPKLMVKDGKMGRYVDLTNIFPPPSKLDQGTLGMSDPSQVNLHQGHQGHQGHQAIRTTKNNKKLMKTMENNEKL